MVFNFCAVFSKSLNEIVCVRYVWIEHARITCIRVLHLQLNRCECNRIFVLTTGKFLRIVCCWPLTNVYYSLFVRIVVVFGWFSLGFLLSEAFKYRRTQTTLWRCTIEFQHLRLKYEAPCDAILHAYKLHHVQRLDSIQHQSARQIISIHLNVILCTESSKW